MSAILGILNHNSRPVDQVDLYNMYQCMPHRGSDDTGFWTQDFVGFGHGMFWTTPEALLEKLPYQDPESRLVISSDARIDNREELYKKLDLSSEQAKSIPDSHYILFAYRKWGEKCVDHLLGDFSFAIWDEHAKKLFCARDHLGIKSFNYYQDHHTLVFATEAEAVLKAPGVNQKVNEGRIIDSLESALEGYDLTSTFFEEVKRLPPAHILTAVNGQVSIKRYWLPDPTRRITLGSDEEYVEAFNELYTNAIAQRMRGNDNVASMLSGGMDSSSVVAIARELHSAKTENNFPVFSAVSRNNPDCRDTYFTRLVLEQGGLLSHTVCVEDLKDLNAEINHIVKSAREPFDPMIMIIAIYLMAKKSGFRVMLDGVEGDMVHSLSTAYPSFLLREGEYREAFKEMGCLNENLYGGRRRTSGIYYENIRAAYTPMILRKLKKYLKKYAVLNRYSQPLISKQFKSKQKLNNRLEHLNSYAARNKYTGLPPSTFTQHALSISHPFLVVAIERYDRVAAQCGIEPRHPLLEKSLVEFMLSVPWNQKVRTGWNKYLMRRSSAKGLPEEVCWRKGWEHLGWDFETEWLSENIKDAGCSVRNMLESNENYFNIQRVETMFAKENVDMSVDMFSLYHLANWIKRQE